MTADAIPEPILTVAEARSLRAARACDAQLQACFWNAHRLARLAPRRRWLGPLSYVEGWVADREIGLVYEHGWCVDAAGQIIDPTLIIIRLGREESWRPGDTHAYYPVYTYGPADLPNWRALPTFSRRPAVDLDRWRRWMAVHHTAYRAMLGPAYDEFMGEARRLLSVEESA